MENKSNRESDVNSKWDDCLDLTARRVVYSSLGGAFASLLFFRSPVTRWASIAFGAGLGIGSAYTDCSRVFDASSSTSATLLAPKRTQTSVSQLILSAVYIISPIDIIPEGILGMIGLLDDLLIALICFLHIGALYRSVLFRHGGS